MGWVKIIFYGDFHDVPRCIVVDRDGILFAFDCPFDDELDDYRPDYVLIRLPDSARDLAEARFTPWEEVLRLGHSVGRVPVAAIRFE